MLWCRILLWMQFKLNFLLNKTTSFRITGHKWSCMIYHCRVLSWILFSDHSAFPPLQIRGFMLISWLHIVFKKHMCSFTWFTAGKNFADLLSVSLKSSMSASVWTFYFSFCLFKAITSSSAEYSRSLLYWCHTTKLEFSLCKINSKAAAFVSCIRGVI